MTEITHEELLLEIERISQEGGDDGATVTELMEQTNLSREAILQRLRIAKARGRLVASRKFVTAIDGRRAWAPCYKIGISKEQKQSTQKGSRNG